MKYKIVCEQCGSEDVSIEATAVWDKHKQDWRMVDCYPDSAHCPECVESVRLKDIELTLETAP